MRTWQADLIQDLGGPDVISVQQRAIVDLAVKTKLMLDSIDVWILNQKSLINQTKRAVLPVVLQRQTLANALADYMGKLGLEKKAKPLVPLNEYIQTKYGPNLDQTENPKDVPGDFFMNPDNPTPEMGEPDSGKKERLNPCQKRMLGDS